MVLSQPRLASRRAVSRVFSGEAAIQRCASIRAATSARAVFGLRSTQSRRVPSTFSGCSGQISWEVAAVKPIRSFMARAFHGSPTQKPLILPMRMFITICGGGTTTVRTSLKGSMPALASQ